MGVHDALRAPGRARGVHERCRGRRRRGSRTGAAASLASSSRLENQDAPSTSRIASVTSAARLESQRSIAASERLQQVGDPVVLGGRVDRHDRRAGPQRRLDRDHGVDAVREHDPDPVAALDARVRACRRRPGRSSSCSSPKVTSRSSTTSAARPGSRAASRARSSADRRATQDDLRCHEVRDRVDRAEVLLGDLDVIDLQAVARLDLLDQLDEAQRVDDPQGKEVVAVLELDVRDACRGSSPPGTSACPLRTSAVASVMRSPCASVRSILISGLIGLRWIVHPVPLRRRHDATTGWTEPRSGPSPRGSRSPCRRGSAAAGPPRVRGPRSRSPPAPSQRAIPRPTPGTPPSEERRHLGCPVGLLAALGDLRRQQVGREVAQRRLLAHPGELALRGQPRGVLEDAVIEERVAPLDAVRHRDPVALRRQQVGLEQGRDLQPGGALEARSSCRTTGGSPARRRSSDCASPISAATSGR